MRTMSNSFLLFSPLRFDRGPILVELKKKRGGGVSRGNRRRSAGHNSSTASPGEEEERVSRGKRRRSVGCISPGYNRRSRGKAAPLGDAGPCPVADL